MKNKVNWGPMLNAYPDSLGGTLSGSADFLRRPEVRGAFSTFYILPSLFHTDLDRGFSVIDYGINGVIAREEDLEALRAMGISLKLDFILNHLSVQSPQFQDLLRYGERSRYRDFFLDWNAFWQGHGTMTEEGYLQPDGKLLENMFFRKPGLPILMVEFADGVKKPYWNTFYQQVDVDEAGKKHYLGQMDLNIKSPLVRDFYRQTLKTLASYGADIVRLDAFAYAPKEVGSRNFLNDPGTWELLEEITKMAEPHGVSLLPEIHASYEEGIYRTIAQKGYLVYDFFLPGLVLDAFEEKSAEMLVKWACEVIDSGMRTVNMLGCHDGIPLLDLKGLLPEERIQALIQTLVARGGFVKDLHGAKNVYYQVNATYYSALGEEDRKLALARAIQLFMPGKPQVWYLDLFAGKNDCEAMKRAGAGGHKEINRTNLTERDVREGLQKPVVQKQLQLLRLRANCPAFHPEAEISAKAAGSGLTLCWRYAGQEALLEADLESCSFRAVTRNSAGQEELCVVSEC
ncbi:alpha-amylase family glycosyl hydrolase [Neglectibacter caecimuris]|uniref:alpha-amylase family glycosyl hydrolase n=1 Tax=Neglectibacter caecimuris TaxID=3093658 RepID=UPI002AC98C3F|nr:alpha-amylase family glycosyl hydrolase [Neglectibacter sp. M00184]